MKTNQEMDVFEEVVSIHAFKKQLKEIDEICRKHPEIFANRSHFFRAAANYFLRHIKSEKFKVSYLE